MDQQKRLSYMKAMGIPVWAARSCSIYDECEAVEPLSEQIKHEHPHAPSALNLIDALDQTPVHQQATNSPSISHASQVKASPVTQPISLSKNIIWDDLQAAASECHQCEMHHLRSHAVFGSGTQTAAWMFIGEAPDVEEDKQGFPFLGKSGELLDNILKAIDLNREKVYLTNILKCRPPNDRSPHVDEVRNCTGYLQRQIELIQPKVIVVVGRLAAQHLLSTKDSIGRMRGKVHYLQKTNTPVVVTYHPRYLLRLPSEKRKVWEDIKLARSVVKL